jgi:hypothetical protein
VNLTYRSHVGAQQISSFTYFSRTVSSGSTVTVPAGVQKYDIAFLIDAASDSSSSRPQNATTLANWPLINYSTGLTAGGGNYYHSYVNYRILNGTEGGTTVTGINGASVNRKIIAVFRPNAAVKYFASLAQVRGQATQGTPTTQVVDVSGQKLPIIVFAHFWGGLNAASAGMSPSDDIFNGSSDRQKAGYKLFDFGETPSNVTVSKNDQGENNVLQSFLFRPTY